MKTIISYIDPPQKYVKKGFGIIIETHPNDLGVEISDESYEILKTIDLFKEHVKNGSIVVKE